MQELLARLDEAAHPSGTGGPATGDRSGAELDGREALAPADQRWAAEHELRLVVSGLDAPVVAAREQRAEARRRLVLERLGGG